MSKEAEIGPTSPKAYAELIQETIFGTNIAVAQGGMAPQKAQELVNRAMYNHGIAQLLGFPVETGSHQTEALRKEWNAVRATQKAA